MRRRADRSGRAAPAGRGEGAKAVGCALLAASLLAGCSRQAGPSSSTPSPASMASARSAAGIPECSGWAPSATPPAAAPGRAVVGQKLPEIVLPCIGGDQPASVRTALAGRSHVINLWASWCGPCRAEAPMLKKVSAQMSGKVGFIGIDYGERSSADGISFAAAAGWGYPQLEDPKALTRTAWGVNGLPVTLLVTADGTVVKRLDGAWGSADQLRTAIRTNLEAS